MKLSRALKLKKKISGEISNLQKLIREENVQIDKNTSRFSVGDLLRQLEEKQEKLVVIKASIAKANLNIWNKIFQLIELKGEISFLRGLDTKNGTFKESRGYHSEIVETVYQARFDKHYVEEKIKLLEISIERLQEEIDEFNYTTTVSID